MAKKFLTNIDANNNDIVNADSITFNTATTDTPNAAGKVVWDNGEGTLAYGLKGGTLDLEIGSENVALCTNNTGSTITKGKVVYINGASGQRPTIALADADTDATSAQTFGITAEDIANGAEGFVTTYGILKGMDTSAFTAGQILYLSSTAGGVTATKPSAPVHLVYVGYVISVSASSGRIFVKPQNGYELDELHDVSITSVQPNDLLAYDSSSTLWKNKSASTLNLVATTRSISTTAPLTGGGDLSANRTLSVSAASTSASGVVQLSDSTSTTSSTLAATSTAVKSAYDLANAAIAKSIVDAKGDLVAATAADTVSRLAVGANNTVLTADSAETTGMKWATAPAVGPVPSGGDYLGVRNTFAVTGNGTFAFTTSTDDTRYAMPIFVAQTCQITTIAVNVSTAAAGGTVRLGIYDDGTNGGDGYPVNLIVDAGTAVATTTGVKELTIATTTLLGGRVYWLTVAAQGGQPTLRAVAVAGGFPFAWSGTLTGVTNPYFTSITPTHITSTAGGTTGAFPSTWGTTRTWNTALTFPDMCVSVV